MPYPRILLADDNKAFLEYASNMLRVDYEIIGRVTDGDLVCGEVEQLRPDLIILDVSMGERSGIQIARQLREQGYAGEIIFLTVHEDRDFVNAAVAAGGRGYVIKSRMNVDLPLAVEAALSKRIFVSPARQDA